MGAPKRNRKKFSKPKNIYNTARIEADRAMIKEYGLKNMHELWAAQTELSRLRSNVRVLLAGGTPGADKRRADILGRLVTLGIVDGNVGLERLLDLKETDLLERRLESRVFKKGLAKSMKQARQLIVHGFISINGTRVDKPGYTVRISEDNMIGYYKPIDLEVKASTESVLHAETENAEGNGKEDDAAAVEAGQTAAINQ
jgi:ribosomal protein S4(archaeal type)/S9(eukaryote cytosolic type)